MLWCFVADDFDLFDGFFGVLDVFPEYVVDHESSDEAEVLLVELGERWLAFGLVLIEEVRGLGKDWDESPGERALAEDGDLGMAVQDVSEPGCSGFAAADDEEFFDGVEGVLCVAVIVEEGIDGWDGSSGRVWGFVFGCCRC